MPAEKINLNQIKRSPGMVDLARKMLLTGVGAVFITENTIRKTLSEFKVPKEMVGNLLDIFIKQKDEVLQLLGVELGNFFAKVKLHEELQRVLRGMQVNIEAKISFDKVEGSLGKVTVKRK